MEGKAQWKLEAIESLGHMRNRMRNGRIKGGWSGESQFHRR
jgi:hypothetical protein